MGDVYAREILGIKNPRVALMNVGGEEAKGTSDMKQARDLLRRAEGLNFTGYIEGRAVFDGVPVVSGGLLARADEVVVDSIADPRAAFGLGNGLGDFVRVFTDAQTQRLQTVRDYIQTRQHNRQAP